MRHSIAGENSNDKLRTLTDKGIEHCKIIANYMKERDINPQLILCSPALRTLQTAQNIIEHANLTSTLRINENLYLSSENFMLQLIQATKDNIDSLMIIGHNPVLHQLCISLVKNHNNNISKNMHSNFPPASLAVLAFKADSWEDISLASAQLGDFIYPKILNLAPS